MSKHVTFSVVDYYLHYYSEVIIDEWNDFAEVPKNLQIWKLDIDLENNFVRL